MHSAPTNREQRKERNERLSCLHTVLGNPYFAVTDENGQFEIKNLPSGEWTFQVWHEQAHFTEVTIAGKKTNWRRGRAKATINGGEATDLGEIMVGPDV